jgi:hypothetical protein
MGEFQEPTGDEEVKTGAEMPAADTADEAGTDAASDTDAAGEEEVKPEGDEAAAEPTGDEAAADTASAE